MKPLPMVEGLVKGMVKGGVGLLAFTMVEPLVEGLVEARLFRVVGNTVRLTLTNPPLPRGLVQKTSFTNLNLDKTVIHGNATVMCACTPAAGFSRLGSAACMHACETDGKMMVEGVRG
jgi:hypothetical protein